MGAERLRILWLPRLRSAVAATVPSALRKEVPARVAALVAAVAKALKSAWAR